MTRQHLLKHPLYAGAYVYGRRQDDPRRQRAEQPRSGRVVMRRADWHAFLPEHAPAYIAWAPHERTLARLEANQAHAASMGAVRNGAALLAGLVVCAQCGARLMVHYHQYHRHPAPFTDDCTRQRGNYGGPLCQHVAGPCLDACVSEQVLAALAPAALELSLAAAQQVEQERAALTQLWQHRRERAAYEAQRAARQYQAVEPANRLVARTLERAWEDKLAAQQQLEEDDHRFVREQPRVLTAPAREAIRQLAADIPALWAAPTTTAADRKEIVRQVVERVEVDAQGTSEQVQVRIHWVGGGQTEGTLTRPLARFADRSDYAALGERVRTLTAARCAVPAIARHLEVDGYAPWRPGRTWTAANVLTLRRQLGLSGHHHRGRSCAALGPEQWWAADLARMLGMTRALLHTGIQHGLVHARQEGQGMHRWIVQADAATLQRLRQYRQYRQRDIASETRRRWTAPHQPSARLRGEDPYA
jgi:hypothetical protein